MLNKIISFSLKNRVLVLVSSVLLLLVGLHTANNMEVDVFPDLNAPTVTVMTEAQGMAAEEVERLVTFPVETALNGATGVHRVRSSSTTGFSVVWIEFNEKTDIYKARQIVTEKLSALGESLPENVGKPTLGPQSSILGEVMIIGLTSDSTSLQDLRTFADWTVRPRLLSIGGVAQVTIIGGDIKEYQILLDPGRMKHYRVSLDEISQAVRDMNQNVSGGIIYEYGNEYIVRGILQSNKTDEIGKAVVKRIENVPVLISDVADVVIGAKTPRLGTASEKGKSGVLITVTKQPQINTLELTKKIDESIVDLRKNTTPDFKISTDIFRQERFIENSIDNVQKSLWEGSIFVVIVLFLFLMNVRTTFISLIALPLSLLMSILVLKLSGLTINTMSLGGMAIAIGSLVDDAIVDVENVYKRLRENWQKPKENQEKVIDVVFEASKEVRMPILNSTLIIIASFLPLFFLSGMEGRMLVPLGISFITALIASTIVALTITPVLSSYLLKKHRQKEDKEPLFVRKLKAGYEKTLSKALNKQKPILITTFILFVGSLVLLFTFGRNFLPPFNEGSFTIMANAMPGISLEESDKAGRLIEEKLLSIEEIQTVGRKTGRAELDEHALGMNTSEVEAPFILKNRSKEELMEDIREKLSTIPGITIEIGQPISHRIDHMLSGTRANIAIKLFGSDLNQLYTLGNKIKSAIQNIEGIADLNVEQQIERPQLKIVPKREMLAKYGITLSEFSEFTDIMLAGKVVSQVYDNGKTFDLNVKANDEFKDEINKIKNLMIDAGNSKIPFEYVAEIKSSGGPNTISRENVQRKLVVSANVAGRDLRGLVNDIKKNVDENIQLPEGYHIEYGGQFESEEAASKTLFIASIFSVLLIFFLIYKQIKSISQSAVILINLPLALIGGILAIWISSGSMSIPAIIGFIALFGIATRNGLLLISHYNDLAEKGYSLRETIMQGSLGRLNPILMTALSSGLALIPLALQGDLPGNEIQSPMAKVILGGLLTSTLLNMYIVPIVYNILKKKK